MRTINSIELCIQDCFTNKPNVKYSNVLSTSSYSIYTIYIDTWWNGKRCIGYVKFDDIKHKIYGIVISEQYQHYIDENKFQKFVLRLNGDDTEALILVKPHDFFDTWRYCI